MGTQAIPTRQNNQTIDETWFNNTKQVLSQDLVPRNTSGVVQANAGSLGSTIYKWLKAHIESGYWNVGDVKIHHSFNGAVGPGQGWMLCDGRQVTQAAYDAEHGAGAWASYVGGSDLENKFLPNMTGKYPVGAATTTQAGSIAITSVGASGHSVSIAHTHTFAHTHDTGGSNSNGSAAGTGLGTQPAPGHGHTTSSQSNSTTSAASNGTISVQPESIQMQYYMRII